MSKQEFIDKLRAALNGRISPSQVIDNLNYYEDYINTQIRMGRTEEEVLGELGDPRLIARTIIETSGSDGDGNAQGAENGQSGYNEAGYNGNGSGYGGSDWRRERFRGRDQGYGQHAHEFRVLKWVWAILGILLFVVVMGFVFSVMSYLSPVIVPILVVVFLVKLFRDWLN